MTTTPAHEIGPTSPGTLPDASPGVSPGAPPPPERLWRLFVRFLRFGFLAWGGPVAQIAMIREELVERERWISREKFNRVLGVYQVLPGPEATELAVYFGMQARGRVGGLLAGLGFVLPGFLLMFALTWVYFTVGLGSALAVAAFKGVQPAVTALIVRAVHRIGAHALHDAWLSAAAVVAAMAQLAGIHFAITLGLTALAAVCSGARCAPLAIVPLAALLAIAILAGGGAAPLIPETPVAGSGQGAAPLETLVSGLRAGLLTFGGAYTVIPFLYEDAVVQGSWLSREQFLDGIALSGMLPAPLVIFSTFVGFAAAGALGSLLMTLGVFVPAFAFTLIGHGLIERAVGYGPLHRLLDGITAGVVGIIGATAIELVPATVTDRATAAIFAGAILALYRFKARWITPAVILGAGVVGGLALRPG